MKFALLVVQYHFSCLQGVLMSYKLVPPRGLYNSDIPNIVRPFTAKRILQDEFTFSRTTIFGLRDYVSAFGNKEFQQQKLLRDIENGRVILLAMSSEFGTLGRNSTGTGQDEFDSAIARIKRSAKDRPLWGYTPEGDSAFSELAAGAYMGFMSAVAEEAKETVEFVSDLVGSTVYEHTGYRGAEAAHKRTEERVDNLIEELKHIDELVEGVAHVVQHPVDTTAAIAENVKEGYDTVSDKLAEGDNYGAAFILGTTAKHAADLLFDSPLENLKKIKKVKSAKIGRKIADKADNLVEELSVDSVFKQNRKFWSKDPIKFNGNKVYQRNDLFDPNHLSTWTDKNKKITGDNIQRMASGRAPIGRDGYSVNLHHMTQQHDGAIIEVTKTFHKDNSRVIHINTGKLPSGIKRGQFNAWRASYWKDRAKGF